MNNLIEKNKNASSALWECVNKIKKKPQIEIEKLSEEGQNRR